MVIAQLFILNCKPVLGAAQYQALEQGGSKMAALTSEELQAMRDDGR